MLKLLKAIAASALLASCAAGSSHIVDTLLLNDGVSQMYGTILATGPNGGNMPPSTTTITIGENGAVDFRLLGCPGCKYTATYNLTNAQGVKTAQFQETWIVPDTTNTLTVKQLWGGSSAPYYLISREQINPEGLLPGQLWLWDGSSFVAAYPTPLDVLASGHPDGYYCVAVIAGVPSLAQGSVCPGAGGSGKPLFDTFTGLFDSATGLFDDN